jgi:APA family basic amino acid/polyamine antiporter
MSIKPQLSRFDLTMIVVSLVIGMGIFRTPGQVALQAGSPALFYAAWLFGGVVTLCGAFTFAEIGSGFPQAGGFYKTLSHCFHPAVAFMAEWVLALSNIASVAAVAIIGAGYINPILLPADMQGPWAIRCTTVVSVLLLYGVNLAGVRMSAWVQNVLTLFKIMMVILLCFAIWHQGGVVPVTTVTPSVHPPLQAFGVALIPVFFTYTGYALTINMGGDATNATRNLPRAIFTGIAIVVALYLAINYAYCQVLGFGGLQQSQIPAATMAEALFGKPGFYVTSLLMFFSVLAYVNVYILTNPRVYYAMATDGVLPPIFAKVHSKTQVQVPGITVFTLAVLVTLFFADSFSTLLNYTMFFNTTGLILGASAIFVLRKHGHAGKDAYRMRLFPLAPVVFIAAYVYLTICIVADDVSALPAYLAAFAIGGLVYWGSTRLWRAVR